MKPAGLDGKSVLVTGGSRGIGRAIVELFAGEGAAVTFFYRGNASAAQEVVATAKAAGHDVQCAQVDVTNAAACASAVEAFADRAGRIDVLVNNAGVIRDNPLAALDDDDIKTVLDTNVGGLFNMSRAVVPYMVMQRAGAIVNVASISGVPGPEKFPGWVSYCASKAAVIGMTEALAVEVKQFGIRVNSVSPGSVDTKMWAEASGGAPAAMTAAEVAEVICFLASDRARAVNGQDVHVYSS